MPCKQGIYNWLAGGYIHDHGYNHLENYLPALLDENPLDFGGQEWPENFSVVKFSGGV